MGTLAWLLCKQTQVLPAPGTCRLAYLEQNAAAASIELSTSELCELDRLFSPEHVSGARYPTAGMVNIEST